MDFRTKHGSKISNVRAYAGTGAPVYRTNGKRVYNPVKYRQAVARNSVTSAARTAMKKNPRAKAFSYTVTSGSGKKRYVGMTTNPIRSLNQHINGTGAKCIQNQKVQSVKIVAHKSVAVA